MIVFNEELSGDLQNRLNLIMQEVPHFWEQGPHSHFTLQGPSHSDRVHRQKLAQLAQELREDERLTDDEIFIVSAAAWLYEIGMQCTTLRPILDFDWQPGVPLTLAQLLQIRERKHLLSYQMIIDSVRPDYSGPPLRLGLVYPDEYTQLIAKVCRWCSPEPLELVPEQLPVRGMLVRVRLLVSLLRLADQLYIDSSRVNLDLLQATPLEARQKARWWAYHYTQVLPINKGLLTFYYFLPQIHRDLLGHIRALIEPEFDENANPVMQYLLREHGLRLLTGEASVRYDQIVGFQRTMSKDMVSYLRQNIQPIELDTNSSKNMLEPQQGIRFRYHTEQPFHILDSTLEKVLILSSSISAGAQYSRSLQEFHTFVRLLKWEMLDIELATPGPSSLPSNLSTLLASSKQYTTNRQRAEHFLQLARVYGEQGDEGFLRYSLAEYCMSRSWQGYEESQQDIRPYLLGFLFLHSQMEPEGQHAFARAMYQMAALYLSTYNFAVNVKDVGATEIAARFYASLLKALAGVSKEEYETLGRCFVDMTIVNSSFMFEVLNRLKTRRDTQYLQIIAASLQEEQVFHSDPFYCIQLLVRINPSTIVTALTRQNLSTAEERKRIVTALIEVASAANAPPPSALLNGFAAHASNDHRTRLAFSILVEPFVLNAPQNESTLKASLIAEVLGLPADIGTTEYFLDKATDLSLLFDRFLGSQDPNMKGNYAIAILDNIRFTRRRLIENLQENLSDRSLQENLGKVITEFFRRTESYVTAEQAKLIIDTTLEIVLVSDRAPHSSRNTHITLEIRNMGEGIADHLVLEVFPVPGKYNVEGRHRIHTIDILANKTPIQKEVFIQPLVDANDSIEFSLRLRYDTLKQKDKIAELSKSNNRVWLYPESQFVRVRQPYNPGTPATTFFYGRKNLLERMADNLRMGTEHDTSMIVYGIKRTGKTSVVRRFIEHTLSARGLSQTHIPIYADLLSRPRIIHTDGDFLFFLIQIITRALTNSERQLPLPFDLSLVREEIQHQPLEAFSMYLDEIMRAIGDKRLLLVLDEFSTLYEGLREERGLTSGMFSFLSNIIQSTHQLTFIFTGTYMLLDMMRTQMYDLAKICTPFLISFLDDTSARQLITEPVRYDSAVPSKGGIEYDPRVIDRIVTYTHCHPYLIQYICKLLVDRMNDLKYYRVNLNDLEAVVAEITIKPMHEAVLLNMWYEFDEPQRKVLSAIASLAKANQSWVEIGEIVPTFQELGETMALDDIGTICKGLADADLLEKAPLPSDQNESYQIAIPLFQMWLKQNKPLRVVFGKRFTKSPSDQ